MAEKKPLTYPYCNACGSTGIISDASARWCMSTQDWDLSCVQDYQVCDACGKEDIAWANPAKTLTSCDGCGAPWHISHLKESRDLAFRLDPGGEVPAGDCPDCGALCYLWKPPVSDAVKFAETAYQENRSNDELQIDRADPETREMHGAIWVKSWTRVRPVGPVTL